MSRPATTIADYAGVADLTRYPINDLASPAGQALIHGCRADLAAKGACSLPGFITPEAVRAMVNLAGQLTARPGSPTKPTPSTSNPPTSP